MLKLTALTPIAQGNARVVYPHPDDPFKVIKVPRTDRPLRGDDNRIESLYLTHLQKRGVDMTHLTRFYGWVETDLGRGAIFERVLDYDGGDAKNLSEMLQTARTIPQPVQTALNTLKTYLEKEKIVFADPVAGNLLWQRITPHTGRLRIIDGLGARHADWKFWLTLLVPFYAALRVKKQWPKLLADLNRYRSP